MVIIKQNKNTNSYRQRGEGDVVAVAAHAHNHVLDLAQLGRELLQVQRVGIDVEVVEESQMRILLVVSNKVEYFLHRLQRKQIKKTNKHSTVSQKKKKKAHSRKERKTEWHGHACVMTEGMALGCGGSG
jgi:hypothetical protein